MLIFRVTVFLLLQPNQMSILKYFQPKAITQVTTNAHDAAPYWFPNCHFNLSFQDSTRQHLQTQLKQHKTGHVFHFTTSNPGLGRRWLLHSVASEQAYALHFVEDVLSTSDPAFEWRRRTATSTNHKVLWILTTTITTTESQTLSSSSCPDWLNREWQLVKDTGSIHLVILLDNSVNNNNQHSSFTNIHLLLPSRQDSQEMIHQCWEQHIRKHRPSISLAILHSRLQATIQSPQLPYSLAKLQQHMLDICFQDEYMSIQVEQPKEEEQKQEQGATLNIIQKIVSNSHSSPASDEDRQAFQRVYRLHTKKRPREIPIS